MAKKALNDFMNLCLEGSAFSESEVKSHEERLKIDPDNLHIRLCLLGYYFTTSATSDQSTRLENVSWVLNHLHDNPFLRRQPFCVVFEKVDQASYTNLKKQWMKILSANPSSAQTLANAVFWISFSNTEEAKMLVQNSSIVLTKSLRNEIDKHIADLETVESEG